MFWVRVLEVYIWRLILNGCSASCRSPEFKSPWELLTEVCHKLFYFTCKQPVHKLRTIFNLVYILAVKGGESLLASYRLSPSFGIWLPFFFQVWRLAAILLHVGPKNFWNSSLHRVTGHPRLLFPSYGTHSSVFFSHLSELYHATCPPYFHFNFLTLYPILIKFVFLLISEFWIFSVLCTPVILLSIAVWVFSSFWTSLFVSDLVWAPYVSTGSTQLLQMCDLIARGISPLKTSPRLQYFFQSLATLTFSSFSLLFLKELFGLSIQIHPPSQLPSLPFRFSFSWHWKCFCFLPVNFESCWFAFLGELRAKLPHLFFWPPYDYDIICESKVI